MNINVRDLQFYKDNFEDLKIKTPDGYQDIGEIYHKPNKECLSVSFSNGDIIECSTDHLFEMKSGWVKSKDLKEEDITINGYKVLQIINIGVHDTYDLEVLHNNHRYYSENIISHNSGKTLIALSAAMRLIDTHKDKYDKIVYIRRTVLSDTEELGFLKGNLDEKMSGFLAPLYSNLEFIIEKKYNNKRTKLTKEELEAKQEEMLQKYQIQFKYEGHLRGTNIRNAIIIWDECQNDTISGAKTLLTRIGDNCKVFMLGSTKQIDSKYLNKYNNALTYVKNKISKDNKNVKLTGFDLDKTVRSAIAEWADDF